MIEKTMEMHDYEFDGKIYRQLKGGAIGMDLTGVMADIYIQSCAKISLHFLNGDSQVIYWSILFFYMPFQS